MLLLLQSFVSTVDVVVLLWYETPFYQIFLSTKQISTIRISSTKMQLNWQFYSSASLV